MKKDSTIKSLSDKLVQLLDEKNIEIEKSINDKTIIKDKLEDDIPRLHSEIEDETEAINEIRSKNSAMEFIVHES